MAGGYPGYGYQPASPPQRGKGWLVAGASMAVVALILLILTAVLALPGLRSGITEAKPDSDGLLAFDMYEGKEYWVYEEGSAPAEDLSCTLQQDGNRTAIELSDREPTGVIDPQDFDGVTYRYAGLFVGDREARVSFFCDNATREILVQPDDDALIGGAFGCCGAMTLGLLAVVIVAVASARRRST